MSTPDLPEDDDPAAYERMRCELEGECFVDLWIIVRRGTGVMDAGERAVFARAMDAPRDCGWLRNVNTGCTVTRHEPETTIGAIKVALALLRKGKCPDHHWRNTDHCGRCNICREPLAETDPKN